MRATVMYSAGDVRVENVPDPKIVEPTDAVIRVSRACVCGSDLWPYQKMEHSDTGRVMGHEAIGVVEDVGADVRKIKRGDFVIMAKEFSKRCVRHNGIGFPRRDCIALSEELQSGVSRARKKVSVQFSNCFLSSLLKDMSWLVSSQSSE